MPTESELMNEKRLHVGNAASSIADILEGYSELLQEMILNQLYVERQLRSQVRRQLSEPLRKAHFQASVQAMRERVDQEFASSIPALSAPSTTPGPDETLPPE